MSDALSELPYAHTGIRFHINDVIYDKDTPIINVMHGLFSHEIQYGIYNDSFNTLSFFINLTYFTLLLAC